MLLHAEDVGKNLAFVIRRTASEDVTIFQNWLERGRIPKPDGIGRLHIVMAIDQDRATAGFVFALSPHHWMTRRWAKFRRQPYLGEFFHQPMSALGDFFGVLIVRRDTGKAEELIKIFKMTCTHIW